MINGLRGFKLSQRELQIGEYELKKNSPKLLDKQSEKCKGVLFEEDENEKLYIYSSFSDEAFALIAHEYKLNLYNSGKAADFYYIYFGDNKKLNVYIYDLKKTLAGVDVIVHLVEQWRMGIATAQSIVTLLRGSDENYELHSADTNIGVVTENNDVQGRKRQIEKLKKEINSSDNVASFIQEKHKARGGQSIKKLKVFEAFERGYIRFEGIDYKYDVREFSNNEYTMVYKDGILRSE